jgi:hypothetical protein
LREYEEKFVDYVKNYSCNKDIDIIKNQLERTKNNYEVFELLLKQSKNMEQLSLDQINQVKQNDINLNNLLEESKMREKELTVFFFSYVLLC